MALFGFGKKKEEPTQQPRVPVDEVLRMRQQGLTNNQVVQALQRSGYQTHQIFDALSQADLRVPSAVQGMQGQGQQWQGMPPQPGAAQAQRQQRPSPGFLGTPPSPLETEANITGPQSPEELPGFGEQGSAGLGGAEGELPLPPEGSEGFEGAGAMPTMQAGAGYEGYGAGAGYGAGKDASERIEEVSEAIIEEKWQDLMKDFNKLVEWKGAMEQRMAALEQRVTDIKTAFDGLQKSVVDKVSDYDRSVKDVGSEMKALEQVFQKVIPTLTENVNELSRITKGMKSQPKK